ncbi:MAG: DivIVA domain-containing protein [Balneolaceae bacterium]|nr:MAG: DivIVA domain-containing protein [Balneolaceae bacterium]
MKLTALEIKQQQFEKALRGYDTAEVHSFLNLIASEWEHLTGKIRELETQVDKMNDKLKHYERVEEALHETLHTAKNSAEERLAGARKEAENIRKEAEIDAESIIQDAHAQRREMRQHIIQLIDKRNEIVRSISSYLDNSKKGLEQFSTQDSTLFTVPDLSEKPTRVEKPVNKEQATEITPPKIPGADKIDDLLDDID